MLRRSKQASNFAYGICREEFRSIFVKNSSKKLLVGLLDLKVKSHESNSIWLVY